MIYEYIIKTKTYGTQDGRGFLCPRGAVNSHVEDVVVVKIVDDRGIESLKVISLED